MMIASSFSFHDLFRFVCLIIQFITVGYIIAIGELNKKKYKKIIEKEQEEALKELNKNSFVVKEGIFFKGVYFTYDLEMKEFVACIKSIKKEKHAYNNAHRDIVLELYFITTNETFWAHTTDYHTFDSEVRMTYSIYTSLYKDMNLEQLHDHGFYISEIIE